VGAFASRNFVGFHEKNGLGYKFVTDWLIKLDAINPQTTARICSVFDNWKHFDIARQEKIKESLYQMLHISNLSKNTYEIITRVLGH
jgi:aminopeptidase N